MLITPSHRKLVNESLERFTSLPEAWRWISFAGDCLYRLNDEDYLEAGYELTAMRMALNINRK